MSVGTLLIIILILILVGALPVWPYSSRWTMGYGFSGGIGIILVIVLILVLMGRI
jgi:hypothetical protein